MKKTVKKTKKECIFKTITKENDEQSPDNEKDLEVEMNEVLEDLKKKLHDSDEESESVDNEKIIPDKKTGKKRKANEKLSEEEKPKRQKKEKKPLLDPDFNLEKDYFYQYLSAQEKEDIKKEIENYFESELEVDLNDIFRKWPNLYKSKENIEYVHIM